MSQRALIGRRNRRLKSQKRKDGRLNKPGICNAIVPIHGWYRSDNRYSDFESLFSQLHYGNNPDISTNPEIPSLKRFHEYACDYQFPHHISPELTQHDHHQIIQYKKNHPFHLNKEFELGFVFKRAELISFIPKIIPENKVVKVGSSDHVIDVFYTDGMYHVLDPNYPEIKERLFRTPEQLAIEIEQCFYRRFGKKVKGMYVSFNVYSKQRAKVTTNTNHTYPNKDNILKPFLSEPDRINFSTSEGINTFYYLCLHGYKNIIEEFLKKQSIPNDIQQNGIKKYIDIAIVNGHMDVVETLINNVNLCPEKDKVNILTDALITACQYGKINIVKKLVEGNGVNFNKYDIYHNNPLIEACRYQHNGIAKYLIETGVDTNVFDQDRQTPLFIATLNNNIELVKLLLANKADFDIGSKFCKTPLEIAVENGYEDIAKEFFRKIIQDKKDHHEVLNQILKNNIYSIENNIKKYREKNKKLLDLIVLNGNINLLHIAILLKNERLVSLLLDNNISTDSTLDPMILASRYGTKNIVDALLNKINHKNDMKRQQYLQLACQYNSKEVLETLLQSGMNINHKNYDQKTALHVSVVDGDIGKVNLLLEKKENATAADVSLKDRKGNTPLHLASKYDDEAIFNAVLNASEGLVNDENKEGYTTLYYAIKYGQFKKVIDLINKGADLGSCNKLGENYLNVAVRFGQKEIAEYLLSTQLSGDIDNVDNEGYNALLNACDSGYPELVELLLKNGASPNGVEGQALPPLMQSVAAGDNEITSLLLRYGADPKIKINKANKSILFTAIENGNYDLVKLLLKAGVDPNAKDKYGNTPLHLACEEGYLDILNLLLLHPEITPNERNKKGFTPLEVARKFNHQHLVMALLKNGAHSSTLMKIWEATEKLHNNKLNDPLFGIRKSKHQSSAITVGKLNKLRVSKVNDTNGFGITALHIACIQDNIKVAKELIEKGAELSAVDSNGVTPLHIAAKNGNLDLVKCIVNEDPNLLMIEDHQGLTPLMKACSNAHENVIQYLIETYPENININHQSKTNQNTALMIASAKGLSGIVSKLLEHKDIDIHLSNVNKKTAFTAANENKHTSVVLLLEGYQNQNQLHTTEKLSLPIRTVENNKEAKEKNYAAIFDELKQIFQDNQKIISQIDTLKKGLKKDINRKRIKESDANKIANQCKTMFDTILDTNFNPESAKKARNDFYQSARSKNLSTNTWSKVKTVFVTFTMLTLTLMLGTLLTGYAILTKGIGMVPLIAALSTMGGTSAIATPYTAWRFYRSDCVGRLRNEAQSLAKMESKKLSH